MYVWLLFFPLDSSLFQVLVSNVCIIIDTQCCCCCLGRFFLPSLSSAHTQIHTHSQQSILFTVGLFTSPVWQWQWQNYFGWNQHIGLLSRTCVAQFIFITLCALCAINWSAIPCYAHSDLIDCGIGTHFSVTVPTPPLAKSHSVAINVSMRDRVLRKMCILCDKIKFSLSFCDNYSKPPTVWDCYICVRVRVRWIYLWMKPS